MKIRKPTSACGVLVGVFAALALSAGTQTAVAAETAKAATKSESGFSFAAYGDSRPMMYLPIKDGQPDRLCGLCDSAREKDRAKGAESAECNELAMEIDAVYSIDGIGTVSRHQKRHGHPEPRLHEAPFGR
mgnify:CR=1 FL=1